jgi:hypothetical protein
MPRQQYYQVRKRHEPRWYTKPVSPTCEVRGDGGEACGDPTGKAYPASGGGWMALCSYHAAAHPEATPIAELLKRGERLAQP